jgi:L,D-transpeptidase catalytic domain
MRTLIVGLILFTFFSVFSSFVTRVAPADFNNKKASISSSACWSTSPLSISAGTAIGHAFAYTAHLLYDSLRLYQFGLPEEAFEIALTGYYRLLRKQVPRKQDILCIADFSQSSNKKRFYVININHPKLLFQTWVAHGRNSGQEFANSFSNRPASNKSSLGFYLTMNTYYGSNGYSLKLRGLEKGVNDNAERREIVMHSANYVSERFLASNGYLGRSQGCPAIPARDHRKVIELIKDGACLFIYHPSEVYTKKSKLINENS